MANSRQYPLLGCPICGSRTSLQRRDVLERFDPVAQEAYLEHVLICEDTEACHRRVTEAHYRDLEKIERKRAAVLL